MSDQLPPDFFEPLPANEYGVYRETVHSVVFKGQQADSKPVAYIMAGQPGSGKSILRKGFIKQSASENFVIVDPDDFRELHPRYSKYNEIDDKKTSEWTHPDASKVAGEMRREAIDRKLNLIVDGTLSDTESALELVEELKKKGYEVHVKAMCVDPETSRKSCEHRYYESKNEKGFGRWVPDHIHDGALVPMVRSLEAIALQGLADSITVRNREPEDSPELVERFYVPKTLAARKDAARDIIKTYNEHGGRDLEPVEQKDILEQLWLAWEAIKKLFGGS